MSLANLIVQPTKAILLTDAAAFWPDGRVGFIGRKVRQVDHLPLAITARGAIYGAELDQAIDWRRNSLRTTDDFLAQLPWIMRDAEEATVQAMPAHKGDPGAFYIALYCERRRAPAGYVITNSRKAFGGNLPPYTVAQVDFSLSNSVDEVWTGDVSDPAMFDVERDSIALVERQRRELWGDLDDGKQVHRVGGWCDLTEVSASGVTIKQIRSWPDRVGELIDPGGHLEHCEERL